MEAPEEEPEGLFLGQDELSQLWASGYHIPMKVAAALVSTIFFST